MTTILRTMLLGKYDHPRELKGAVWGCLICPGWSVAVAVGAMLSAAHVCLAKSSFAREWR